MNPRTEAVGAFYDRHHEAFLASYGRVIQAFRTRDPLGIVDHEARRMSLAAGQKLLDAGCGVGAPAIHFATLYGVEVEGITASAVQAREARTAATEAGCGDRVRITQGDYHEAASIFPENHFDAVCFLESFGHSHDKGAALRAAYRVLRPGGTLYIKDLFLKEPALPSHEGPIRREVERINAAYHYEISDLYEFLRLVRQMGFILADLSTIDIPLHEFENLTISNDFQELTGIARIEDWKSYVFPVDFFEVRCIKPWVAQGVGSSRYFLQNLYHLRVMGDQMEDL